MSKINYLRLVLYIIAGLLIGGSVFLFFGFFLAASQVTFTDSAGPDVTIPAYILGFVSIVLVISPATLYIFRLFKWKKVYLTVFIPTFTLITIVILLLASKFYSNYQDIHDQSRWNSSSYGNSGISVSYPVTLIDYEENGGIRINSGDYKVDSNGEVQNGFTMVLYTKDLPFTDSQGLVSTQDSNWLGNQAKLQIFKINTSNMVLSTTYKGKTYKFVLTAPSDSVMKANKDLFLKIGNTIRIRG